MLPLPASMWSGTRWPPCLLDGRSDGGGGPMTVTDAPVPAPVPADADKPRAIVTRVAAGDRVFRGVLRAAGLTVLVITAGILAFLLLRSIPAFRAEGFRFFTTSSW